MIKTEKKLSIFLKLNEMLLNDFEIVPTGSLTDKSNNEFVYNITLNINLKNKITIHFLSKSKPNSYLHVTKVQLDGIDLNFFDSFCTYYANGKIKKTNGWLDEVGSCIINIHCNSSSQNLLLYLLAKHA